MGVVSMLGKIVLVVVNIIILLLSLALLAIGIVILAGKDLYNDILDNAESELQTALTASGVTVDTGNLSFTDLMLPLAYALVAMGIVFGIISLLGCCGSCYTIKIILVVYTIITGVLFLIQLIIVILVYQDKSAFDATIKSSIKDTLSGYSGIEGTDAKTLAWNALMNYKECCGVDDYNDFQGLNNWPPATVGGIAVNDLITPIMCCKTKSTNYDCAKNGTATTSNNWMEDGCYDALWSLITDHSVVVTFVAVMLAAQFILIFFSIWIICTMDNKIDII